ncbi:DUF5694 domain-containing protein [Roseateles sp.]|uniref:DUF5694 domain-containing protein n=1 Tax=Roseateles sp. TaxID=1971397 RepID=UPI0032653E35
MKRRLIAALGLALLATTASAAPRAFAGPPTRIVVLGTPHLADLATPPDPAWLAPLLDRLAASRPELIVIEAVPGEQCDQLRRLAALYAGAAGNYCPSLDVAARSTGLDAVAALTALQQRLADWPATPTAADRRRLAGLFAAAGESASAVVQWLRLPADERREGDGVDAALAAALAKRADHPNENYAIAARLAARLGHERVYAVDDHTADSIQATAGPGLEEAMGRIWANPQAKRVAAEQQRELGAIRDGASLLAHYRWTNAAATLRAFADADHGAAARDVVPPYHGRQYLAWWETRNLRMVAAIRAAVGTRPGARVLALVGASHKRDYERLLGVMTDWQVDPVDALLRP